MYNFVQKSGGPKTTEGRAASSKNAIKMGAYAKHAILPGEDSAQFDDLLDRLMQEYDPQGVMEASLVRDIAMHIWRKLRVERLESAYFLKELYREISTHELTRADLKSDFAPARSSGAAKRSIIDERLYTFVLRHNTQRPIEDINRSLFKVMSELRRQQEWRLEKRAAIFAQSMDCDEIALRAIAAADALNEVRAEAVAADVDRMIEMQPAHKTD
jgi:hypothetical protein